MALKQGYGFSRDNHRRVSRVVQQFEHSPNGSVQKGPTVSISDPIRRGKITTAITIRSGNTPGKGKAKFQTYDRDNDSLGLTAEEFDIKNDLFKAFSVNSEALFLWRDGVWWVIGAAC